MGFYGRSAWQRQRDRRREVANAWKECPVRGVAATTDANGTLACMFPASA
ncbi:hypothetical protein ABIE56_000934 [Luteibacter sp. 621]